MGVATDEATGEAAVANNVANTATVINLTTASASSVTTGQRPVALAFNYTNHQLGVANSTSNSASFGDASSASLGTTSVIYDPVANNFLVNSSTTNTLQVIDPGTFQQRSFRIGINPTALAYNYLTSTLVSTNTLSHTLTVVDFLGHQVRAVLPLPAPSLGTLALAGSLQFGVDIHPRLNLAVVADTANGNVLFVPLPH
jgi:DNA-binding beta-propeller fold protein YncE